jgi:hypothetical protein
MDKHGYSPSPGGRRRHLLGKLLSASAVAALVAGLVATGAAPALAAGPGNNGLNPTGNGTTSDATLGTSLTAAGGSATMDGAKGHSSLTCSGNNAQSATGSFTLTKTLDVGSTIVVYLVPNNGSNAVGDVTKNQTTVTLTSSNNTTGSVINWSISVTSPFTVSTGGILGVFAVNADYNPPTDPGTSIGSSKTYSLNCTESTSFQPTISTSASSSTIGGAITDSATLLGTAQGATGGSITFTAYGPESSATCSTTDAVFTKSVTVSGDGTYGPVGFTPTAVGAYYWIASYNGDPSTNTLPIAGSCGDTGETSSVSPNTPSVTTTLSNLGPILTGTSVSDQANILNATSNAGGTISYGLYSADTCSSSSLVADLTPTTDTVVNGVAPASKSYTFNNAGTFYFRATYSGDANNTGPVSSSCESETLVVNTPPPPGQGYFQFTKTVAGNLTGWTGGTFPFTVTCVDGESTLLDTTVNLPVTGGATASWTSNAYPEGTTCTVVEGTLPSAGTYASWVSSPTYSPTSGSQAIVSGETVTVAVTNTRSYSPPGPPTSAYGYFQFSKTVTGNLTGWSGGTFPFTVTCAGNGQTVNLPVDASGDAVTSDTFGPYAAGTVCSVVEGTLPAAGTNANWANSPHYSPSGGSVTIVANQTVSVSVLNTRTYSPATTPPSPKPTGGVAGATGTPHPKPTLPATTEVPGQGGAPNGTILLLLGLLGAASLALITLTLLRERLLDSVEK